MKTPPNSIQATSGAEWRKWLALNHKRTQGIWLIRLKKAFGKARLDYDTAV